MHHEDGPVDARVEKVGRMFDRHIITALERIADGREVPRHVMVRLGARGLIRRRPRESKFQARPAIPDLTPLGRDELDRAYANRSRIAMALMGGSS